MKTTVIINNNGSKYDGDTGTVDGYINVEGKTYAVVILDSSHKFVLINIYYLMEI